MDSCGTHNPEDSPLPPPLISVPLLCPARGGGAPPAPLGCTPLSDGHFAYLQQPSLPLLPLSTTHFPSFCTQTTPSRPAWLGSFHPWGPAHPCSPCSLEPFLVPCVPRLGGPLAPVATPLSLKHPRTPQESSVPLHTGPFSCSCLTGCAWQLFYRVLSKACVWQHACWCAVGLAGSSGEGLAPAWSTATQ